MALIVGERWGIGGRRRRLLSGFLLDLLIYHYLIHPHRNPRPIVQGDVEAMGEFTEAPKLPYYLKYKKRA